MSEKNIPTQQPKENYLMSDEREKVDPVPQVDSETYNPADKLKGKNAIITGADSGIGRAVAIAFAKEGANVALIDLDENEDLQKLKKQINKLDVNVLSFSGDVGDESFAKITINKIVEEWGSIDTLVNNAAEQHQQQSILDITAEQLDRTFRTNVYGMFYFTKEAFPHFNDGGTVINTSSITAYRGSPGLMDYSSTKGAITAFTRSFAQNKEVIDKKMRVNAVAPGPIWTPLIPATLGSSYDEHGEGVPINRPGEPYELAPAYVYLASSDSSYVTGQTIHVNGGTVING